MDESEENMSSEDTLMSDSSPVVKPKPKKKSLIERELETNLTARITSPVAAGDGNTSRYGRARRAKGTDNPDFIFMDVDQKTTTLGQLSKPQSPVYKMHASNSPIRSESAKKIGETFLDCQIESIYQENISLSRFSNDEKQNSSSKKYPKVYVRKDLIQNKEPEETITLIKSIFSPNKSERKSSTHLNNVLERSSERYSISKKQKYLDNSSVVKTLDFDSKKKKENAEKVLSKSELFEMEAQSAFQVGDLAWARMGTYPFWPCIVTREPSQGIFIRKKLFGRITRDMIHVTFFGDNGRRGWIVDSMLRKYLGLLEFETARENYTAEDKKRDPKLYAAYFISEKKRAQWNTAVEESESLYKEPKRLRTDIFNEMLQKARIVKTKKGGKISRTDSDVSLSESLYDSLFSEDDGKGDSEKSKRSRNKSLDMIEVVTACLDDMAARTGISKIQKQSHMDRWLQKAKSKTPEKFQAKPVVKKREPKESKKQENNCKSKNTSEVNAKKPYTLRKSTSTNESPITTDNSVNLCDDTTGSDSDQNSVKYNIPSSEMNGLEDKTNAESVSDKEESNILTNEKNDINSDSQTDIEMGNTSCEPEVKIERNDDFDSYKTHEKEITRENIDNGSTETLSRSQTRRRLRSSRDKLQEYSLENPEFLKYLEIRQDLLFDENPDLSEEEVTAYLFKTWLYEQTANNECVDLTETVPVKKPSRPRDRERDRNRDRSRKSKKKGSKSSKRKSSSKKSVKTEDVEQKDHNIKDDTLNSTEVHSDLSQINNDTFSSSITNCDSSLDLSQENEDAIENKSIDEDLNITSESKKEVEPEFNENQNLQHKETHDTINVENIDTETINNEPVSDSNNDSNTKMSTCNKVSEEESLELQSGINSKENIELNITTHTENIDTNEKSEEENLEPTRLKENYIDHNITTHIEDANTYEKSEEEITEHTKHKEDFIEHNTIHTENSTNENSLQTQLVNGYKDDMIEREGISQKEMDSDMSVYDDSDSDIVLPYSPLTDHEDLDDVGQKHFAKKTDEKITINQCSPTFTERQSDTEKCSPDNSLNVDENKILEEKSKVENGVASLNSKTERILPKRDIDKWINNVSPEIDEELNGKLHKTKRDVTEIDMSDNKEVHINFTNTIKENGPYLNGDITSNTDKKLKHSSLKQTSEIDTNNSVDSEDSVSSTYSENKSRLKLRRERSRRNKSSKTEIDSVLEENNIPAKETKPNQEKTKQISDPDFDTLSIHSEDSVSSTKSETKRKLRSKRDINEENPLENPGFVKYLEMRQDAVMDENPELSHDEIVSYLHKTWLYEENAKSDEMKNNELLESNLVKGLHKSPIKKKILNLNKNNLHKYLHKKEMAKEQTRKTTRTKSIDSENQIKDTTDVKTDDVTSTIENMEVYDNKSVYDKKSLIRDLSIVLNKDNNLFPNETEQKQKEGSQERKDAISEDKDIVKSEMENIVVKDDFDAESIDSYDSETPLIKCKLRAKARKQKIIDEDVISINSEDSEVSTKRKKKRKPETTENAMDDPEFIKYLELRQDTLIDEHPELTHHEIVCYLYKTWLYEESNKSEIKKNDDKVQSNLVKGLESSTIPKKIKRNKIKVETDESLLKEKPKRTVIQPYYNEEEFSDIEDELEVFEIFRKKYKTTKPKTENNDQDGTSDQKETEMEEIETIEVYDDVELYFKELTKPKPNIFKGLLREKVCEICEKTERLVKCKGCNGMFHVECVQNELAEKEDTPIVPSRGRKKKKKMVRKLKSLDDSDDKSQDISEENNLSIEDESHVVDADAFEAQLAVKMKELLEKSEQIEYEIPTSEDELLWNDIAPGKCEIIDSKLKPVQTYTESSDFKCNNCQKYDTPVCFVCKSPTSKKDVKIRQKCSVGHCNKYYHLDCLDQWPQTQFNGGGPSKNSKKINEHFETVTCPRHVCHTCVCDDPRGCKTRFSGDKLARCVRCPATYHSFTKCLPAGSLILSASQIVCPRHTETRPGKVPCHVNTGWCFICALGGSLICCEYCPTSFHAECLNIKPPEGGYMCEDCETGRLPLYGEMVWVKLGHYRWWPGIILHPTEIPENILAVKHSHGEFVVRFFGQYDHYWVNRGRVFPFQEGDSGRISSQKSKIDAAFTTAMEHAIRACEILKTAKPNEEESLDIASSLLPPHYVKLRVNKPCGTLTLSRRPDDPESSLTQCDCHPHDHDPCGPYSQCLNRMLLTECGPTCRAGDRCNNRAFERRSYPKLVPYRTPSRGWGLKTLENIKPGQFVIEYVGELIDEEEFRRRMKRKHEIRDENYYFLTLDKDRMIDAGPKGNLARFMNHCCEPNCETQKWTVLGDVRVGLFAITDIPANSEVTFNYNLECAGIEKKRCMCGAKRCSGYIGAKPKQDESQTKKNKLQTKRTYKKRKVIEQTPPAKKLGRPRKQRELTEIEKDLLIIKNATNSISSDESGVNTETDQKPLKRRASVSTESEIESKRLKVDEKCGVGD